MQLAHVIVGQALVLATGLVIFNISENAKFTKLLNRLAEQRIVRIADEKGVILLMLTASYLILPVLEFLSSQAKVSRYKTFYRRAKAARASLFCCAMVLYAAFISAYIFKALSNRVYNLFGLSFVFMALNAIGKLVGLRTLDTWGYFGFTACTLIISLLVFIANADIYYSTVARSVTSTRFI